MKETTKLRLFEISGDLFFLGLGILAGAIVKGFFL